MRHMMVGLKTTIWVIINCNRPAQQVPQAQQQLNATHVLLSEEERDLMAKFFKYALPCLQIYTRGVGASTAEAKEIFDVFGSTLHCMQAPNLRLTVGRHLHALFTAIMQDFMFMSIPQYLLMSDVATSAATADMLMTYLMWRISDLQGDNSGAGSGGNKGTSGDKGNESGSGGKEDKDATDSPVCVLVVTLFDVCGKPVEYHLICFQCLMFMSLA